jgi:uncharacterized membrane protein
VSFELAFPSLFLALITLPILAIGQRKTLAAFTPAQRRTCFALRATILVCLTLALVGIRLFLPSAGIGVVLLVDESASISPEAKKDAEAFVGSALQHQSANDSASVVHFAGDARNSNGATPSTTITPLADAHATNVEKAMQLASALIPANQRRRIVLLSDGNETEGHAASLAAQLASSGTEIWTVPLRNPAKPEVLIESITIPGNLREGEPFTLSANIKSNVDTSANVRVYQSKFLVADRTIQIKPGDNDFQVPSPHPEGSFVPYDLEVVPDKDTSIENNRSTVVASMRGQPRILLVDQEVEQARHLEEVLRREGMRVELRDPTGAPRSLTDLQQFDLFILSDTSALLLGRESMELYRRWVEDFGGGLVLVGGENGFGVGGYSRTPIEQMLPVRLEHDDREDLPTVALLVVLDRSGSMTAQVAGQTKMALANQGAALALNVLGSRDYFGVFAVDTRAHVIAPLARHGNKEPVVQKVLSITAGGGGIYIYTSLAEAFQAMRDVNARIKHVILFSDAADAEEKNAGEQPDGTRGSGTALDLAAAMVSEKISISVVALGTEQDRDSSFLRQLAERGQGRFYLTNDATTLPQIFSTETMKVAQSSLIEEPTQAVLVRPSPMLTGLDWAQSPLLLGYNATKPKPTADVLLATERGEPLLATWRYGLGQVGAFTSDAKPRWASEWIAWSGYAKFWSQVVRAHMRKSGASVFQVSHREVGRELEVNIDAITPEGAFRNHLPIMVTARSADGSNESTHQVSAIQTAPGAFRARLPLPERGTLVVNVSSSELPDGGTAFAHTRDYPREFLHTGTNESLLRELAGSSGGRFDPKPADVFQRPDTKGAKRVDLTNWFLIAAIVLMPLDIYLRRRAWATWSANNRSL